MIPKKTIILVEDNSYDMEIIIRNLKDHFDIVDCFDKVEDLVDAIKSKKSKIPDVVLLDLGLPRSWGYETFEKALPIVNECCIVVLTGLNDDEVGKKAIMNGALDYISKDDIFSDEIAKRIGFSLIRKDKIA